MMVFMIGPLITNLNFVHTLHAPNDDIHKFFAHHYFVVAVDYSRLILKKLLVDILIQLYWSDWMMHDLCHLWSFLDTLVCDIILEWAT